MPNFVQRFRLAFLALLLAALPAFTQDLPQNERFGRPERDKDAAFAKPALEDHHIVRPQYIVSYNGKKNSPNWVSWNLRKSDIGPAERKDRWKHDKELPADFQVIKDGIYSKTGFARGHMCPSEDRTATQADNDATFMFSNAVPQAPANNSNGWMRMEKYCQDLAKEGNDLHIVCGPQGRRGQGNRHVEFTNFLVKDNVKITVPAVAWKVVLVLPNAKSKPSATTRTIAIVMPNDQSVTSDWAKFRCSIEHVEELTDFKFFPKIRADHGDDIADALRERIDAEPIKKAKKVKKKKVEDDEETAATTPEITAGGAARKVWNVRREALYMTAI